MSANNEEYLTQMEAVISLRAKGISVEDFIAKIRKGKIRPRYEETGEPVNDNDLEKAIAELRFYADQYDSLLEGAKYE